MFAVTLGDESRRDGEREFRVVSPGASIVSSRCTGALIVNLQFTGACIVNIPFTGASIAN